MEPTNFEMVTVVCDIFVRSRRENGPCSDSTHTVMMGSGDSVVSFEYLKRHHSLCLIPGYIINVQLPSYSIHLDLRKQISGINFIFNSGHFSSFIHFQFN